MTAVFVLCLSGFRCAGVQRTFTVRNYVYDSSTLPNVMSIGFYKIQLRVLDNDTQVAGLHVVVRVL